MEPQRQGRGVRLAEKVAVITGAARGIGAAVTRMFAQEGARVMGMDISSPENLADFPEGTIGYLNGDVSQPNDCQTVIQATVKKFGAVHILVNNAAISFPGALHQENSDEFWHRTLETNLHGVYYMTKAVLPVMMQEPEMCSIINISSIGAMVVNPVIHPSYAASKGAINALTRVMAPVYAKYGIRFNAICPGGVKTPLWYSAPAEVLEKYENLHPLGAGDPQDIASLCVYLGSDESKWVTGSVIVIDGGNLCAGGLAQMAKEVW